MRSQLPLVDDLLDKLNHHPHATVLVRSDLNVPIENNKVSDPSRIIASLPTWQQLLKSGAKLLICSHLGRPSKQSQLSLELLAPLISQMLEQPVSFANDLTQAAKLLSSNNVILLENTRLQSGETQLDEQLAYSYAQLADYFVFDAFACAHRAEVTTSMLPKYLPAYCGHLVQAELMAVKQASSEFKSPLLTIIGGAKINTKLPLISALAPKSDHLVLGGGMLNTLIAGIGKPIGKSYHQPEQQPVVKQIWHDHQHKLFIPEDLKTETATVNLEQIGENEIIGDFGEKSIHKLITLIGQANTIIWNGPLGIYEDERFCEGSKQIAVAISQSKAYSLVGGGDTQAVINTITPLPKYSHLSTAGGALLSMLSGEQLPAIVALEGQ